MLGKWTCARTDAHLDEALMGELGLFPRRSFNRHRRECTRCHAVVNEAVEIVGLLRSVPMETPRIDISAAVLAARAGVHPSPSVSWVRYAHVTVTWAVCLMVMLMGITSLFWPGFWEAPQDSAVAVVTSIAHSLEPVIRFAMTAARAIGAVVWAGIVVGLVAFYSAAFAGLRHFLVRRPI